MSFHISRIVTGPFDAAIDRVKTALQQEGFGVLTDIDVAGVLKAKIGVERPAYRILGACKPDLARQALEAERHIGVMLPCNVVVQQCGDAIEVSAIDPRAAMRATGVAALEPLAEDVAGRLTRALERLN